MKNLLFTVALSALAVTGNAQSLVASKPMAKILPNKVMTLAPKSLNLKSAKATAVKKSPTSGVGFGRPEGTMYSEYAFSADGQTYDQAALMIPSITDIKYEHYCQGKPTWTIGEYELTNVDSEGNLILSFPAVDPTSGYNYGAYNAPTATYAGEDFQLTAVTMIGNDYLPVSNVNTTAVQMYTGFTDGPAWGTGSVLEGAIKEQVTGAEPFGIFQPFEQPAAPMSLQSIHVMMWSENSSPLAGKQMTAKLYRVTEDGIDLNNPEATFACKSDPDMKAFSSGGGYYGQMYFYNYVNDPVLGEIEENVNIDYPFAILIEGYQQDGVDVRFFLTDQADDVNEFYFASPTRVATNTTEGVSYYYWANTEETTERPNLYMYTMPIGLDVLYDVAKVWQVGSYQTGESEETTKVYGMNLMHISDDGQSMWREGDDAHEAWYSAVYTVFPWSDDSGEAAYKFDGCPDWLTINAQTEGYPEDGDSYYTKITATATPLPEGTTGRIATVYVTSDKGAKSTAPFVFAQGDAKATAISTVDANATKNLNSKIYNLAGQRVNNNAKGILVVNGKKVIR